MIPEEVYERWVPYTANNWIRDTNGCRMMRIGGGYSAINIMLDSLDDTERSFPPSWQVLDKYTPPFLDSDHPAWVAVYDLAHYALAETDFPREKTDENDRILAQASVEATIQRINAGRVHLGGPANRFGPAFANFHLILAKIKKALDPNNVANPTRLIDMEAMEKAEK